MKLKTIIIFFIIILLQGITQSQTLAPKHEPSIFTILQIPYDQQGKIVINQSKEIENIVLTYIEEQKKEKLMGYRIRIFSASGNNARNMVYAEKERFESLYPSYPVYIEYETPNFKAYVGDFRNKIEALRVYYQINKDFKNCFVVPSYINLPRIN